MEVITVVFIDENSASGWPLDHYSLQYIFGIGQLIDSGCTKISNGYSLEGNWGGDSGVSLVTNVWDDILETGGECNRTR